MVLIELKVDSHFISTPGNKEEIRMFELDSLHTCKLKGSNWKELEDQITDVSKDELKVYDVVIRGKTLRDLGNDLWKMGLTVNRQGCCVMYTDVLRVTSRGSPIKLFGVEYYRLNDFFGWSKYGVSVPPLPSAMIWHKVEMNSGRVMEDRETLNKCERRLKEEEEKGKQKDEELKILKEKLVAEQKRVAALKAAINSIVDCL